MKLKDWLAVWLVLSLGCGFASAAIWQLDKLDNQKIEVRNGVV